MTAPPAVRAEDRRLRRRLDAAFLRYHRADYIETDPVRYPHRYSDPLDIEVAAFYSALLAYGNMKAIFRTLDGLFRVLGPRPATWLVESRLAEIEAGLSPLYHRFTTAGHLVRVTRALQCTYRTEGSLRALFLRGDRASDETIEAAAVRMIGALRARCGPGDRDSTHSMKHLLASPERGSACKRLNLFLRWMVRHDEVDFGLWPEVSPARLVMPMDTHILQISREWGLQARKSANWRAALELTGRFRRLCPEDPVKYDFALTRLGMGVAGPCEDARPRGSIG